MLVTDLPDGLYRVTTGYFCAGFVIKGGRVVRCAPILWRRIDHWLTVAEPVEIDPQP